MNDKPSLQELLEVQAHFGLPSPALVEKDWYVVKALAAINAAQTAPFRLIFSGGTALARAHKLIGRMSEDIDLKIVAAVEPSRSSLRHLRDTLANALFETGFHFDPKNSEHVKSRNESRYTLFQLPYEPIVAGEGALRPEIQIEAGVWTLHHPPVDLSVTSFMAEAFHKPPEVRQIACASITQTAAEKFVALTRRTAAEIAHVERGQDITLVRHIYDLHIIRAHYNLDEVAAMVRAIMEQDAAVFGNQFPAYRADPLRETKRAVEALTNDLVYEQRYEMFLRDMVFGEVVDYAVCLQTIRALAARIEVLFT